MLRKSCITNWARGTPEKKDLPMHVVKELAGHSNIATTAQFCLTVTTEDQQAARDLIQNLLTPDRPKIDAGLNAQPVPAADANQHENREKIVSRHETTTYDSVE